MSDGNSALATPAHRLLLADAATLHERFKASPDPFNVFSVLRSSSDEVNLHSRFLYALLNHATPSSRRRDNLTDFVERVIGVEDLAVGTARVERERDGIDILISDDRQAIVIENKIWAGDQDRQLQRYHDTFVSRGFEPTAVHLTYLTPFGDAPSEGSLGALPCKLLSYRDDLPPWLERCQRCAVEQPALREAIAQYRALIRRLTDTDYETIHMNELKRLLLEGDNLILAHDLLQAREAAIVDLVHLLWEAIDSTLHERIPQLPDRDPDWADLSSHSTVDAYVRKQRGAEKPGLYYRLTEAAWLGVEADHHLFFGIYCDEGLPAARRARLKERLSAVPGRSYSSEQWPWWQWVSDPTPNIRRNGREELQLLASERSRAEVAVRIANVAKELWDTARTSAL